MVKAKLQFAFFDTEKVLRAVDKGTAKALSKVGAFVRRSARTLTKKRGTRKQKISSPGEPPRSHTGRLRDLIYFGFDDKNRSVAIGPVKFGKGDAPPLLEFGGHSTTANGLPATYRARPFMGPALRANQRHIPSMWANSVKT